MANYEYITDVPCEFLQVAADTALDKATEAMGGAGAGAYLKEEAHCTENCILASMGCHKQVTVRIRAPAMNNPDVLAAQQIIYDAVNQKIQTKTSTGECADGIVF